MIHCPRCNATLTPETKVCQFCGKDVSDPGRRVDLFADGESDMETTSRPVAVGYALICLLWVVEGILHLLGGLGLIPVPVSPFVTVIGITLVAVGSAFWLRSRFFVKSYQPLCVVVLIAGIATAVEGIRIAVTTDSSGIVVATLGGFSSLSAGLMSYFARRMNVARLTTE